MSYKHPSAYEPLVLDRLPSPPRSRLYHLEPIGIGSPLTESFTSYLARLAHAHRVGLWSLIKEEILPVTKQVHLIGSLHGSLWGQAQALNGVGIRARRWVEAVGQLTGRQDLMWLTMLPWAQMLSYHNLVRNERAWCPQCLRDWRASKREVYEPLLWALQAVTVCPIHEAPLRSRCPHEGCGQRLPPMHSHLRPGRCSRCLRCLDHRTESRPNYPDQDQMDRAQAVRSAKAIGDLLAAAPTLHALLRRDRIPQALRALCQAVTQGNLSAMARLAGLGNENVRCWTSGHKLPQLKSLLRLCDSIGTTPLCLLRDGGHTPVLKRVRHDESPPQRGVSRHRKTPFPITTVRTALEAVLADREMPPPSLQQVAERLGYHPDHLGRRFRELCRAIAARHRQNRIDRAAKRLEALLMDIRLATRTLAQQGLYPGMDQVQRYLRKPGMFRNPRVTEVWRMTLKELGVTPGTQLRKPKPQNSHGS